MLPGAITKANVPVFSVQSYRPLCGRLLNCKHCGCVQTKQELATVNSRAAELDSKNKHLIKKMEDQEASLSQQIADFQDRAQKVGSSPSGSGSLALHSRAVALAVNADCNRALA